MKRRHLRQDVIDFCSRARSLRPEVAFGADIIAGFPTETDEMFENTLKIIDDCDLSFLHVFPYSAHPDTPASRMPQVPKDIIKRRAAILRNKGQEALHKLLDRLIGQTVNVLVESVNEITEDNPTSNGNFKFIAHGKNDVFAPVDIFISQDKAQDIIGKLVKVKLTSKRENNLQGELL